MESFISIKILMAKETLMEIEMPVAYSEDAILTYTQNETKGRWGKFNVKKWSMPGLCVISEVSTVYAEFAPELNIYGPHVSAICSGSDSNWNGTVELRDATNTSVTTPIVSGDKNQRLSIIFSRPFLSILLQNESWIKNHDLYKLLTVSDTTSEYIYRYFLELPIKRILSSLLHENLAPLQKRYYFELKLKELFFMLHLQPESYDLGALIPSSIRQKLVTAKAYLLVNYHTAPTITQLSRIVALNEFKLKHFFKISFGTTIKAYVIALRMEAAKTLLENNHSVSDVASRLGYKNVSHFILIFKRTFGETPRQIMREQGL